MQKNKNVKNVKEYVKQMNISIKNYKITSNRNVKPNTKRIYKSNKYIEMYIKIYIYTNMKINKYIEMHVEQYLFEIIKEYIKNKNYKNM